MAVSLSAQRHALAAGCGDLQVGSVFYTKGPRPCAREYDGAPGGLIGSLEPGTKLTVLEAKTHIVDDEWVYVAIKVVSVLLPGMFAWVNIQADRD